MASTTRLPDDLEERRSAPTPPPPQPWSYSSSIVT
jgi:hypothetical protein